MFRFRNSALLLLLASAAGGCSSQDGNPRVIFRTTSSGMGTMTVAACKDGQGILDCFGNTSQQILAEGESSTQAAIFDKDIPTTVTQFPVVFQQAGSAVNWCGRQLVSLAQSPVEIDVKIGNPPSVDCNGSCSQPCCCDSSLVDPQNTCAGLPACN